MPGKKSRLISAGLAALLLVGALAWTHRRSEFPSRPAGERPPLMLVTTLPLVFPDEFSLHAPQSPLIKAVEQRYRIIPIGVTEARQLGQARMLMMAHPLAQPAEALVDLDGWVQKGGRLLLLADPKLDWPSERPLGDVLRPPPSYADTGLLAHWGLRLDSPDHEGPAERGFSGRKVRASSPGRLSGRGCEIAQDGFVAHCRIGKGRATIVADADFLRLDDVEGAGSQNLEALLAELARLEP